MNKYHNLEPFRDEGVTYKLRQWMNVVFILASVAGVAVYYSGAQTTGLYIIGGAIALKFVELTLRMLKL